MWCNTNNHANIYTPIYLRKRIILIGNTKKIETDWMIVIVGWDFPSIISRYLLYLIGSSCTKATSHRPRLKDLQVARQPHCKSEVGPFLMQKCYVYIYICIYIYVCIDMLFIFCVFFFVIYICYINKCVYIYICIHIYIYYNVKCM